MARYEAELTLRFDGFALPIRELYASPLLEELRRGTAGQITAVIGNAAFPGMRLALDFCAGELGLYKKDHDQ